MRLTCEKSTLAREISIAQEIVASKNALSIMSNVLLDARDGSLSIRATDIKVGFETTIPVDVAVAGMSTVFCDKLSGILSSLPEGEIELDQDDQKVVIKPSFKKVRFQVKTISSEKFPELPEVPDSSYFSIPVRDFKEMIQQTVFAVSDDETRYFMNGVFLENNNGTLVMVATDGRRLAFVRKEISGSLPELKGVIVPPKLLSIIVRRAPDEGVIELAVTDRNLFIKFGNYRLSTVLIEGQFPNYQKVIPESQKNTVMVKRSDLLEALKRVSIFVEQKSRRTYFGLAPGVLILSSEESELGTAREEIPCRYDGPDVTIALNYKYVEDPLKVMSSENVLIEFTDPAKAITLSPDPRADFFHIVMPMQLE
jgi:DNA polymerase-3 subunit beta